MSRVVYGAGPVSELVSARPKQIAVLYASAKRGERRGPSEDRGKDNTVADARGRGIAVEVLSDRELDALAGGARHQGLVAISGDYPYADVDDVLAAAGGGPALIVALDSVQDPRNLGAIVRSAYLLGAHGLLVPRDRAAQITASATKASAGATECLPIAQVTNLSRALDELKQSGVWIAGVAAGPEAVPIHELDATGPVCLVMGSEGSGIRRRVASQCDFHVVIPMAGTAVGSFNVSVAASLALYEVVRQRSVGR